MTHKIMLYSHDSWGLGHLRRSLAIAHQLNRTIPDSTCLVATGSPLATTFPLDLGVEIVKLPSVTKDGDGQYQPRQLRGDYQDLISLRRNLLYCTFDCFEPDILIVDHQLVGLAEELIPVLQAATDRGTICIYGMRDVLDSREATEQAWSSNACQWALRDVFHKIWVYGDQQRFDTVAAYPTLAAARAQITFTGLIQNGRRVSVPFREQQQRVLVTAGGGEDGLRLLQTFVQGINRTTPAWHSTIVAGPLLHQRSAQRLQQDLQSLPNVSYHRFHESIPSLLNQSDTVVSMAGYNSCAEIIAARCPAVLVPRTKPRREQLIRARYLALCGAATCLLEPNPAELMQAVERTLRKVPESFAQYPRSNGLTIVSQQVAELLSAQPQPAQHAITTPVLS